MLARGILLLCFFIGVTASAQDNTKAKEATPAEAPATSGPSAATPATAPEKKEVQKEETRADYVADGFFFGLDYESLKEKAILTSDGSTTYSTVPSDTFGFFGVRLGYGFIPKDGLGFTGDLSYARSTKKNYQDKTMTTMRGEGSLTIGTSINEDFALYGFGGFHLSWIDPSNDVSSVGFGVQAGAGFAFDENWAVELGGFYTIHKFKDSFYDSNPGLDKDKSYDTISGWFARLNYNF